MSLKKTFGENLGELLKKDKNFASLGIKSDTFYKYVRGDRFPKPEIIEKIKNHYNVPYSYLFGEYDNKNLDTSEISGKLGLSEKSIEKLEEIGFEDNIQKKQFMTYALNQIIENVDFLEFGELLLIPSKNNKHIKSENIYKLYSDYINTYEEIHDYSETLNEINKKQEYNDFILNKRLFKMFQNIRNSKECASIFINYVNEERKIYNDSYEYIFSSSDSDDNNDTSHFHPTEEMEKVYIQEIIEREELTKEKNEKLVRKRKKKLDV